MHEWRRVQVQFLRTPMVQCKWGPSVSQGAFTLAFSPPSPQVTINKSVAMPDALRRVTTLDRFFRLDRVPCLLSTLFFSCFVIWRLINGCYWIMGSWKGASLSFLCSCSLFSFSYPLSVVCCPLSLVISHCPCRYHRREK